MTLNRSSRQMNTRPSAAKAALTPCHAASDWVRVEASSGIFNHTSTLHADPSPPFLAGFFYDSCRPPDFRQLKVVSPSLAACISPRDIIRRGEHMQEFTTITRSSQLGLPTFHNEGEWDRGVRMPVGMLLLAAGWGFMSMLGIVLVAAGSGTRVS